MAKLTGFVFVLLLVTVQPLGAQAFWCEALCAAGGVAMVTVGAPFALTAAGFTAGGIVAGSVASKVMSVVYSSQVGLGPLAFLQSAGAAGFSAPTVASGGLFGAGACHYVCSHSGK